MTLRKRLPGAIVIVGLCVIFVLMAHWGGAPRQGGLFVAGVLFQLVLVALYVGLGWYLLFRPLPTTAETEPKTSLRVKQIIGMLIGLCGINFVVGGIWDAVWHLRYGIPFGADLLWRPHLLMYSSFMLIAVFAIGGLVFVNREGRGTFAEKFRQHPLIGLLALVSGFMLIVVGLDPLWHTLYGGDISAWSLPHLILVGGFDAVMVASAIIQAATHYRERWNAILTVKFADVFILLPLLFAGFMTLLLGTVEWVDIRSIPDSSEHIFWQRPEWLYPVICVTIAVFMGTVALQLTKRIGASTVLGASILGLQYLTQAAAQPLMPVSAGWLCLMVMVGIDLAYFISWRRSGDAARWVVIAAICAFLLAIGGIPIIAQTMIYPRVNSSTIPWMVLVSLVMASGAAWLARRMVGGVETMLRPQDAQNIAPRALMPRVIPIGAAVTLAAFIVIFVITATPPA